MFGAHYNTLLVMAGAGLLGLVSGVVGAFAVLRRRALMGDAVAHAALPGICFAFLLIGERNFWAFLAGAVASGVAGVLCVTWLRAHTRIKDDAAIGIVLSVFFGLGIVLLRRLQSHENANVAGLESFLLGQTAGMVMQDLLSIAYVCVGVLVVLLLLFKEFKALSFDREFARVQGWPVLTLDILLMALLVVTTVVGLPAVGVVLMAALLIIPGVSARFWTEKLPTMLALSGVFGLLTGVIGTFLSAVLPEMPAGPVIVLSGCAIFLFSMFFAPRRGILSRLIEQVRLRMVTARQNLLRSMYELNEDNLPGSAPVSLDELVESRAWSRAQALRLLADAQSRGDVKPDGPDAWSLTTAGLQAAASVVRTHRLWETFLIEHADIAPDHVDRDADQIEHVLSPDLIKELEARLREDGRLPEGLGPPASPHEIVKGASGRSRAEGSA
ncbi:MAG TPA: iron chelate uptake ABC transporter family permease subunit [Planctomycetota bacterium]|nr:iron chelate uptake ABC transporter family permease subunit [Planctomycetota bacterium]